MNKKLLFFLFAPISIVLCSCGEKASSHDHHHEHEEAIQHIKVDAITDFEKAQEVFAKEIKFITKQTDFSSLVLHEIHMSTYSLEKAVEYFAKNTQGEAQKTVQDIAEVVEYIHIDSENNRAEETKVHIAELVDLIKGFSVKE